MRRFRYDYQLTLDFSRPVSRHTFLLRFFPQSDKTQQVWGVESECDARLSMSADAFGNALALGHIERQHTAIRFAQRGEALISGAAVDAPCASYYRRKTPLTQANEEIASFAEGLSGSAEDIALQAAHRMRERVAYQQGITGENTTACEALSLGAGVCQDMAHLLLASLREVGIPARYAAGLIPGEGETHAWVQVHDGKRFIGVDPTHLRLTDDTYLTVNVGRDSRDCAINRGVFSGSAQQGMIVRASMTEL